MILWARMCEGHGTNPEQKPATSDVGVCLKCGALSMFNGEYWTWEPQQHVETMILENEIGSTGSHGIYRLRSILAAIERRKLSIN